MKLKILLGKSLLKINLWVAILLIFSNFPIHAQENYFAKEIRSDDKLFISGYDYYQNDQYTLAAIYLFAYIQRDPDRIKTDQDHKNQVFEALSYAMGDRYDTGSATVRGDTAPKPKPTLKRLKPMSHKGGQYRYLYVVVNEFEEKNLESFLNYRASIGLRLISATYNRSISRINYGMVLKKVSDTNIPWRYKVRALPAREIEKRLNLHDRKTKYQQTLIAVTPKAVIPKLGEELYYMCFFEVPQN